jgi:hypothetical protein
MQEKEERETGRERETERRRERDEEIERKRGGLGWGGGYTKLHLGYDPGGREGGREGERVRVAPPR